jgi:hypothetical protein
VAAVAGQAHQVLGVQERREQHLIQQQRARTQPRPRITGADGGTSESTSEARPHHLRKSGRSRPHGRSLSRIAHDRTIPSLLGWPTHRPNDERYHGHSRAYLETIHTTVESSALHAPTGWASLTGPKQGG